MTLQEIIVDIHALNEDLEAYERKYGVLSETFYESHTCGEEPEDESWVLDWADWAGAYKIFASSRKYWSEIRLQKGLKNHKTLRQTSTNC